MSFKGYKLKAKLYAAHSNLNGSAENSHFHTFTLVLYLKDLNENMDYFFNTEKEIQAWLEPFQNKVLSETELFRGKSTSLESIGDIFYDAWKEKATAIHYDLIRLDVYENPVRTYTASDYLLDDEVNEINAMPCVFSDALTVEKKEEAYEEYIAEAAVTVNAGEMPVVTLEEIWPSLEKERVVTDCTETLEKKVGWPAVKVCAAILFFAAIATGILYSMKISGNYPQGSDTLCHLYRADVLLNSIKNGVFYPLYDNMWYNGVEIMRYWAPVPLYILAGFEAVSGSMLGGYLLFVASVFFVGAMGWLLLGVKLNRVGLSVFVGVIWFFLPENMRLIILDGNLPRVVINTVMPFLLLTVWNVVGEKRRRSIVPLTFLISFIGLCHVGIALMAIVTLVIFLCFYGKANKAWPEVRMVLSSTVIGMLMTGIWLIPSLHGSGAGNSAGGNQVMQYFFESAFVSLNPVPRWNGNLTIFYYGLSVLVISVIGIVLGTKKTLPGFATGVIIFVCTTKSVYQLFEKLPFSQFLWMIRFVTISMAFILFSLLLWKGLKRGVVVLLCGMLLLDCIPSYRYIYEEKGNRVADVSANHYALGESLLLNKAKEITTQRMAVFDLSTYGAFAPYYVTGVGKKVPYTFGAGWEGARTASNIVKLNSAIENGNYTYVFDRSIELGTDTLVFDVTVLKNKENDVEKLVTEGKRQGYELVERTNKNLLFHKETPECFGICSSYENIAIGTAATDIALLYPVFEEGGSANLSDYTVEELSAYKRIFLADFTYNDKSEAERMLTELAERGVKVFIDMNKVPVNVETNLQELFGVGIQTVTFQDSFPDIEYNGKRYHSRGFVAGMEEWKANYLIGLSEITGYGELNGVRLPFAGVKNHENIVFLGYNFVYYAEVSSDIMGVELLSDIFDVTQEELPERSLVPLSVAFEDKRIIIQSEYENVNTALANIDIFRSDREVKETNHLITVGKGTTVLSMNYPYFREGLAVSFLGAVLFFGYMIYIYRRKRYGGSKKEEG